MCRRICCVCEKFLGKKKECDCDQETHTYCEPCMKDKWKEIHEWLEEQDNNDK